MQAPLEVGIVVRDLERMIAFYRDILGCREISRIVVPPEKTIASALSPDGLTIVRLQTAWGERIKLLSAASTPEPEAPPRWLLARCGLAFLTLIVRDLDGWFARLRQAGVALASDAPVENRPGLRVVFFRDPEGNMLEAVEYADLAGYRPDLAPPAAR